MLESAGPRFCGALKFCTEALSIGKLKHLRKISIDKGREVNGKDVPRVLFVFQERFKRNILNCYIDLKKDLLPIGNTHSSLLPYSI